MPEAKKNPREVVSPADAISTSMARALEEIVGHGRKLSPEQIERLKKALSGKTSSENLEELFADYATLLELWNLVTHGPEITEVIGRVLVACKGLLPTGDGDVNNTLTSVIKELSELDEASRNLVATPEQWQQLHKLLKQTESISKAIKANVNPRVYSDVCAQIEQANELFKKPAKKRQAASSATATPEEIITPSMGR